MEFRDKGDRVSVFFASEAVEPAVPVKRQDSLLEDEICQAWIEKRL